MTIAASIALGQADRRELYPRASTAVEVVAAIVGIATAIAGAVSGHPELLAAVTAIGPYAVSIAASLSKKKAKPRKGPPSGPVA